MDTNNYFAIALAGGSPRTGGDLFDLEAAAEYSGMHPGMIHEFGSAHFVPIAYQSRDGAPYFDLEGLWRLRQIERLRCRQRVNLHTIRYILRLQDRLEATERELRLIRQQGS